ncbi:MAG: EbsA family protein [Bacteroidales bacterium]|nr:EbsA family protein [Bacteroidales bacterium]
MYRTYSRDLFFPLMWFFLAVTMGLNIFSGDSFKDFMDWVFLSLAIYLFFFAVWMLLTPAVTISDSVIKLRFAPFSAKKLDISNIKEIEIDYNNRLIRFDSYRLPLKFFLNKSRSKQFIEDLKVLRQNKTRED